MTTTNETTKQTTIEISNSNYALGVLEARAKKHLGAHYTPALSKLIYSRPKRAFCEIMERLAKYADKNQYGDQLLSQAVDAIHTLGLDDGPMTTAKKGQFCLGYFAVCNK